ncbi:MAG: Crp/Fnr family transcriptional regulator [Lautropia sp.]
MPITSSSLVELCRLLKIAEPTADTRPEPAFPHRRVRAGVHLVCAGQPFESLYVLNAGFMKASLIGASGAEQVTAFPIRGDLIGADGLSADRHPTGVVALTDCDVVVLPMNRIARIGHEHPEIARSLLRLIAGELVREQTMVATLSMPSAEARVAHFLVEHGQRMKSLGFSDRAFELRMTRRDIGSYLSLQLETVSRTFSAFARGGLIAVDRRSIRLLDVEALRALDGFARSPVARAPVRPSVAVPAGQARAVPVERAMPIAA